ncbi:LacI family transcriptional regulator [Ornithinimicrobium faecis]|uniref:LacI family transcriptional regulator n=1 Tax=Ornithinimicrobium faecis TaxID=2934158 RepID=A0ABY4YQV1_9MICO|nr:LacI family DNA-binding transcriptional regulator [Ornithinimicrobium sp. HY1793]USQ79147.1 LacI family transcriptional regulator [Ornithinimicrobium sp. HY1793]
MAARSNRVTISDVARQAGVSSATVSRALSGNRPMSPELAEHVRKTAQELGYRTNLLGRALRQQRSSVVGLLVPDLDNPFFASLAEHLSRVVETSDMELLVASAGGSVENEARLISSFLDRQVAALVAIPCDEIESAPGLEQAISHTLTVQLDRRVLTTGAYYVGCDNRHGMDLIAEHVAHDVDTTAQPVVYVGAETQSSSAHERLDGFRRHFPDSPVFLGDFSTQWGQEAADQILESGLSAATIVATADVIALGLMSRLHATGHRIPEDFRVIGFDGVGVTPFAHPTLTTVRQPVEAISRRILDLVLELPQEQDEHEVRLEPTLVVGPSSPARDA